ncbi:MAG: competence protein TfoX [Nitrospinae bacterium CG11_big_fil_rev_8_21_14_0_20_45_15]|nr:MAG: competence protein TfoX [Nitrospinae bacterium CG11_big_fil_rev_8_21_14_0_20_45_15]
MTTKIPIDDSFRDYFLEQLDRLSGLTNRRLFGGYGFYLDGKFFAILYQGRVYFKTDIVTRAPYLEQGMQAFRPTEKQTLKNYYEVPAEVLEDSEQLMQWALRARQVP